MNTSLKFSEFEQKVPSLLAIFALWKCSDDFQLGMVPSPKLPNLPPWCACFHSGYEHGSVLVQIEPSEDIRGKRSCMQHDQSSESSCCNRTENLQFQVGQTVLGKVHRIPPPPQKKHHPKSFCLKSGSTTPLLGGRLTPELFTQSDWPIWKIEWKELVVTLPRNPVWRALLQVLWLPGSTSAMPVIHPRRRLHVFTLQTRSVY